MSVSLVCVHSQSSPEWPWATCGSGPAPWSFTACTFSSYRAKVGVPDTTNFELLATVTEVQSRSLLFCLHMTL